MYIVKRKSKSFLWIKTYFYDGFYIPLSIGQEVFSFSNLMKQLLKYTISLLVTNVTQLLYRNFYRLSHMLDEATNFSFLTLGFCSRLNEASASFTLHIIYYILDSLFILWVFSTESQSDNWKFWVWVRVRFSLPVKSVTGRSGSGSLRQQPFATNCHDKSHPFCNLDGLLMSFWLLWVWLSWSVYLLKMLVSGLLWNMGSKDCALSAVFY